jgi:hypothetical protein
MPRKMPNWWIREISKKTGMPFEQVEAKMGDLFDSVRREMVRVCFDERGRSWI